MEKLRSPQVCAALVMILWLATLIAFWGMAAAGRGAIQGDTSCTSKDIENKGIQLEMTSKAEKALKVLNAPGKEACIQRSVMAQVHADYIFIPGYSLLTLALFLFVGSMRKTPAWFWGFLAAGLLLAAVMAFGDVRENFELERIVHAAGGSEPRVDLIQARLPALQHYAFLKMSALALSAVLLSVLWTPRPLPPVVWVLRLFGFAAAGLFVAGMAMALKERPEGTSPEAWQLAFRGMVVFFFFWLSALVHAVAVAVGPEPLVGDTRS